jgi:hypothetical protein
MGRKRTGCTVEKAGVWYAQLTVDYVDGGSGKENFPLRNVRTKTEARTATTRLARAAVGRKFPRSGPHQLVEEAVTTFDETSSTGLRTAGAAGRQPWARMSNA